jgi:hypothetical protein
MSRILAPSSVHQGHVHGRTMWLRTQAIGPHSLSCESRSLVTYAAVRPTLVWSRAAPTLFWAGQQKGVLDHGEEAARLFVVIVSVDGGFLDQLVEVRCMATARSAIVRFFMNCLVRNLLTKIKLQIETR